MKTPEEIAAEVSERRYIGTYHNSKNISGGGFRRAVAAAAIEADRAQFAAIKIRTDDWNNAYLTDGDEVLFQITDRDTLKDLIDIAADPRVRETALTFVEVGLPDDGHGVTE